MIAALILAHQSPELLARLVKRLESYGAHCFIHIDAKVDIAPFEAACAATNSTFINPRTKVTWGGFSIVEATISLLSAALTDARFTHFVVMSGDSYPVKPRVQFRHLVTRPFEQISGYVIPTASETYKRIAQTFFPNTLVPFVPDGEGNSAAQPGVTKPRVTKKTSVEVEGVFKMKQRGFPWKYSKGGQWWSLTAEAARKCLDVIARETEFMKWFQYSVVPDEALFQTIIENFGPFRIGGGMPVYTVWDPAHTAHPCVFTDSADLERLQKTFRPLARKFSFKNGPLLLDLLDSWMDNNDDVAYGKPAVSSSASVWARYPDDPKQDACGANGEYVPEDYGFFTRSEREPWWMVDLLGDHTIEGVAIVNRLRQPQRFRTFAILSSNDNRSWRTRFTQAEPIDVSSDPDSPWRVQFAKPFTARYVRIAMLGQDHLHLRRVQVFGRSLAEQDDLPGNRADDSVDLAYCKPAVSSSASPWARYQDPKQDACGANGESLADDFGFFTRSERKPWWMVDLLGDYAVEEIAIVNRLTQPQRFRTFSIESSSDNRVWRTRFIQADPIDVSSDPESPWRVPFASPFAARYVRIGLLGDGYLHLRRVQIFGRPLAETGHLLESSTDNNGDLAYCKPAVSSSVSPWARYPDPKQDACGANGESLAEDFGFFTGLEREPWWMVDLLGDYAVEEIAIVNRLTQPQRFQTFSIQSSIDDRVWRTRFTQAVPKDVSADPESPWRVRFAAPLAARYVRIALIGRDYLHLRRVQIFGRPLAEAGDLLESCADNDGDLAYCKPAVSSSVSPWARHPDPKRDACGANGESLAEDFGFFTAWEREPWWMVDLLREYAVEEIAIVNRVTQPQRFRTFSIQSSSDDRIWMPRFTQTVPTDVSSDPESPWRLQFDDPFAARYVRVALIGEGYLHLRRVQIRGRPLADAGIAAT